MVDGSRDIRGWSDFTINDSFSSDGHKLGQSMVWVLGTWVWLGGVVCLHHNAELQERQ